MYQALVREAVGATLSRSSSSSVLDLVLEKYQNTPLPSRTTIGRHRLTLDVALLLVTQRRRRAAIRVGWADSSPLFGYNYLMTEHHYVMAEDLELVFKAVNELAKLTNLSRSQTTRPVALTSCSQGHGGEMDDTEWPELDSGTEAVTDNGSVSEAVKQLSTALYARVHVHTAVPVALGAGMANLAQKASAVVHASCLECKTYEDLEGQALCSRDASCVSP